jgi:hypothetical protein
VEQLVERRRGWAGGRLHGTNCRTATGVAGAWRPITP